MYASVVMPLCLITGNISRRLARVSCARKGVRPLVNGQERLVFQVKSAG